MADPTVENDKDLVDVLNRITFVNTVLDFKWSFKFRPATDYSCIDIANNTGHVLRQGWFVWVEFERPDTNTGEIGIGRGRDEVVWKGTTLSGVVKTCWVLVEMIVKHELMEGFRFCDKRIFNPHNSVFDLMRVQG